MSPLRLIREIADHVRMYCSKNETGGRASEVANIILVIFYKFRKKLENLGILHPDSS
jgi:hypothetical protein